MSERITTWFERDEKGAVYLCFNQDGLVKRIALGKGK